MAGRKLRAVDKARGGGGYFSNRENTDEDRWLSLLERDYLSPLQIHAQPCTRPCGHSGEPSQGFWCNRKTDSETNGPPESRISAMTGRVRASCWKGELSLKAEK